MGKCKDCGAQIEIDAEGRPSLPCLVCGGRSLLIELVEQVEIHEMIGIKAKLQGKGKPVLELKSGEEVRVSRGDWVSKDRRIDRQNDHYMERVVDKDGNVIHEVSERLSGHAGHGSARKKRIVGGGAGSSVRRPRRPGGRRDIDSGSLAGRQSHDQITRYAALID